MLNVKLNVYDTIEIALIKTFQKDKHQISIKHTFTDRHYGYVHRPDTFLKKNCILTDADVMFCHFLDQSKRSFVKTLPGCSHTCLSSGTASVSRYHRAEYHVDSRLKAFKGTCQGLFQPKRVLRHLLRFMMLDVWCLIVEHTPKQINKCVFSQPVANVSMVGLNER